MSKRHKKTHTCNAFTLTLVNVDMFTCTVGPIAETWANKFIDVVIARAGFHSNWI